MGVQDFVEVRGHQTPASNVTSNALDTRLDPGLLNRNLTTPKD